MPGTGSGADGEEDFGDEVGADDAADAAEEGDHVGGDAVADEDGRVSGRRAAAAVLCIFRGCAG